ERFDQVIDRAGRDALDVGLLDHRRQRLLGQATGLEETGEINAFTQLRDPQLDGASSRVPVAVAIAVALVGAALAALAVSGAAESVALQRHQALGGEADHLAQEAGVGALLQKFAKGNLVVGHRGGPRVRVAFRNPTLPSTAAVATAVDKSPAYARLLAVAPAGDLPTAPTPPPGARPGQTPGSSRLPSCSPGCAAILRRSMRRWIRFSY